MIDQLLALMTEKRASDLFFTAGSPITIKISGSYVPINGEQKLDHVLIQKLLFPALGEEQIHTLTQEKELNMSLSRPFGRFRLSAFYQQDNLAAVIRYVPTNILNLEELRLPKLLADIALAPRGLVILAGATGSGKSSTIAAMLEQRNQLQGGHILTVEDPIEFVFTPKKSMFSQREVGSDTKQMHIALKNALRQAPEVLFIGEVRTQEAMSLAISYALSGHLVVTTLHANNSYHALSRIVSMYPPESREAVLSDLSSALRAVVSQRLVKAKSGGRVPAVELFVNNQLTADLITQGKLMEVKEAIEKSLTKGSQTFEQALFELMEQGLVEAKQALAVADSPTNLQWLIDNQGMQKVEEKVLEPIVRDASGAQYKEFSFNQ